MSPTCALPRRQLLAWGLITTTPGWAQGSAMDAAIRLYTQGRTVQAGRVRLEVAELVDNGNAVPVTLGVDLPPGSALQVQGLALFNERNPQPEVVEFDFGPGLARPQVATRIRLATSQKLVAVAQLSDGSCWSHSVDVVVTLAACIEGDA